MKEIPDRLSRFLIEDYKLEHEVELDFNINV